VHQITELQDRRVRDGGATWHFFLLGALVGLWFMTLAGVTPAADEWTTTNKSLFVTSTALLVADWGQTRYVSKHPEHYQETNPLLGDYPSTSRVNNYFAGVLIGNFLLTHFLSAEYRNYFQIFLIGAEARAVTSNHAIGVKVAF
jgi:hypothetical protein